MSRNTKRKGPVVDPEYLEKQKASLLRGHRQVVCLNDKEMAAVDEYCRRFKVKNRSGLFREALMERVLSELEENHPTLF
ncbi:MAG: ribbon-helix-helix protein, CopG family [Bacteroidales bacterium]|nr:ribbon-helix-helix protein, CopG family [Bacteroidales bacterium]